MKKKTKWLVIIITSIILVCVISIAVSKMVAYNNTPVVLFDKVITNIDKIYAIKTDNEEKERLKDETNDLLDALNLSHYDDEEVVGEEFVQQYLEEHTKEEFLHNTIKLYIFLRNSSALGSFGNIRDERWHAIHEEDCQCQRLTTLLNLAFEANNIEIKGVTSDMAGATGYYTENPNAEPLSFEETHSGRFYDRDGTNGRDESKTDTGVVTYYGDYAILSVTRYVYQKGQYGWRNGIFYDELPSWECRRYCELYYKGEFIQEADSTWELLNGKSCVIDINGKLYEIGQISVKTYNHAGYADTHTFIDIRYYK